MKARIPDEESIQRVNRRKGRELIDNLRSKGWSDDRIADALGVPRRMWKQFLINIGMNPFINNTMPENDKHKKS